MALQPGRQLRGGSCHDGRLRPPRRLIAGAEVKNICTLTARFRPFSVTQLRIRNGSSCPEADLRPTQSQGQRGVDSGPSGLTANDRTWDF
jgi:hypothetical protein